MRIVTFVLATFLLVSDGSALASWLEEDTPHEMVTMFHPDRPDLVATHDCSAHNRPRMVLLPGTDPNRLVFRFKDGANIHPGDGHMEPLAVSIRTRPTTTSKSGRISRRVKNCPPRGSISIASRESASTAGFRLCVRVAPA